MSSVTPTTPAGAITPANNYPKRTPDPKPAPAADGPPKQPATPNAPKLRAQAEAATQEAAERHHAAPVPASTALSPLALSSADVSYVKSLMGALPAQKMEEILLKTGVPIPANLGPNIDTAA